MPTGSAGGRACSATAPDVLLLLLPRRRYGSGLVIYWFGYLADLANDAEVLILDRCPSVQEIRVLPQLQLALGA